ncbi:hypothetical protein HPB47_019664 [Ixodes persulcatus]|uniref:Uncharacterized protein n=1 Tax=Ixodes persulcatus TaxID=34615 RepID=A0AC60QHU6_IXOPE|nr:hypothetical protein HPB47_019664 [Ixodes persulcatus]
MPMVPGVPSRLGGIRAQSYRIVVSPASPLPQFCSSDVASTACRVLMASNAKKRTSLTFAMKLEIIRHVEKGEKKSNIAEAYNIPRSTLSTLLKTKGDIKSKAEHSKHSDARRVRTPAFENVERSLHKRFMDARARNIPVSGPMLQQKAKDLAFIHKAQNFAASSGWLQHFKARYDIVGKTVSGEREDANMESIKKWLKQGRDLKIDLLGAIQMLKAAWENVKQEMIANCFRHAGFVVGAEEPSEEDGAFDDFEEPALNKTMTINDFVGDDEEAGTTAKLTDVEIAAEVNRELASWLQKRWLPNLALQTPRTSLRSRLRAKLAIDGSGLALVDCLETVERAVIRHAVNSKKQSTLRQFFSPE